MFGGSAMLTIGAALDRAQTEGLLVQVSFGGEWISGRVINNDQHGIAFLESSGDVCVLRPSSVDAVRMPYPDQETRPTAENAPIEMHAVTARP